ncbi:MAG: bifunctional serine/threonine-protein kinase/ABC transporter substrate-binding protein, partial [Waterburya sp.]
MLLSPNDIVGSHYQIIQILGKGGFGITYLARDNNRIAPNNLIALKQIFINQQNDEVDDIDERSTSYLQKLEQEARVLSQLQHDRIPKFFGRFEENGYFYIAQEYIEGHSLTEEILPGRQLSQSDAIAILREILLILQFVHAQRIIHRDIKPANLIRRHSDNKIVLIDFGAVKEINTQYKNSSGITLTKIIGSPGYMPPEQARGNPQFNSDIYAVGIILLQAITGFSGKEIYDLECIPKLDNKGNYIWEDYASQLEPEFQKIVSKMIQYCFGDRYISATDVLQDLKELDSQKIKAKPPDTEIVSFPSPIKIPIKKISLVIATCAFTLALVAIFLKRNTIISIFNPICNNELQDHISCGEEVLDPQSKGAIRRNATEYFADGKYQEALEYFQQSWQDERQEAETLIYMNNALLEATNADYYTIAIAVPLTYSKSINVHNPYLGQDFLRGIAQAQTEVNLNLIKSQPTVKQKLPGQDFLNPQSIHRKKPKGLKVVIVDDGNNKNQAQELAANIINKHKILGLIGHYASDVTVPTIDIYNQKELALISFGSTTKELTLHPRSNFFRVVYSSSQEAEALVDYLNKVKVNDKKIAIFYNPASEYANYFWIETKKRLKNVKVMAEFNLADPNFSSEAAITKIQQLKANVLLLIPDGQVTNSASQAVEVIKKNNNNSLILGGNVLVNPKIEQINTEIAKEKFIVTSFWHPLASYNSQFIQNTQKLWGESISGRGALTYDATLALIKAIESQNNPTRKGTLAELKAPGFSFIGA